MSGTISNSHQLLNAIVADSGVESAVVVTMGEKKKNHDVTGKTKSKIRTPAPIREFLTNIAHGCIVVFVLVILYLCFKQPFEFFTWHPLLLSIGWMLLMMEAILAISKENMLTRKYKVTHTLRLRLHWVPLTIAAVLIGIGFIIITLSKNMKNKYHYTSWHGLLGLIGVIAYIPPCINGVATLYGKELRSYMNPKLVKLVHVITGTLCLICGGISLILSVYTKWFARRTENNQYLFFLCLFCAIFPVIWVVQRPLIKVVKNVAKLFSKDE